jgi:murein DD-endopeptidase MepM/ murein hydrolase activator NlpD
VKLPGAPSLSELSTAAPLPTGQGTVREVATEFEGLLMNELLKTMRKTVPESPFFGGFSNDVFTSMLDEQLSRESARGGALGLTGILERQLGGSSAGSPLSSETMTALADGRWVKPVDSELVAPSQAQSFGASRPGHIHAGIDLAPGEGTPVRAAAGGVVTAVSRDPDTAGGLSVELSHHGGRLTTRYLHLEDVRADLVPGSTVAAGETLGAVGDTGSASHGAHLHFELEEHLPGGTKNHLDPEPYVRSWPLAPER